MDLLSPKPNLQGIGAAVNQAAQTLQDPTQDPNKIAEDLIKNVAKALQPNSNPNVTINKLINNGIDENSELALGAYATIFKLGLNMAFSGVPGFNQTPSSGKQFAFELAKFLAPDDMLKLQQNIDVMNQYSFSPALDSFRAWKY